MKLLSQFAAFPVVIIALFAATIPHGFVNLDDPQNFLDNPYLRTDFLTLWNWSWRSGLLGVYQPISWQLLWIQSYLSNLSPHFFHGVSAILQCAIGLLVWNLSRVFWNREGSPLSEKGKQAALLSALLFSIHPLRVEAVAWISCQPYLWSALFGLLSARCYLLGMQAERRRTAATYRRWSLIFLVLGLLCKAILFTLPILFLCFHFEKKGSLKNPRQLLPHIYRNKWFLLASLLAVLAAVYVRGLNPQQVESKMPLAHTAAIPFVMLGFSIWKTVFPWPLSPFNPLPEGIYILQWISIFIASAMLWLRSSLHRPNVFFLGLAVLILAVPGIGAALTERIAFEDRFVYLPSIALAIGLAPWLEHNWVRFSAVVLLVLYFALSLSQIRYWGDSELLWKHAVKNGAGRSAVAHGNLATAYLEKGQFQQAENSFLIALEIDATKPEIFNGLGVTAMERNDRKGARDYFETAVELRPNYAEALNNLAYIELLDGNTGKSLELVSRALQIAPHKAQSQELKALIMKAMEGQRSQ